MRLSPGILRIAALSAATVICLALPASTIGATRVRSQYSLQFEGLVDCGAFMDAFTDYYDVSETDVFDTVGNLVQVMYQAVHRSDDSNSVTGLVLHEHGHFTEVDDLLAETVTITGASEVLNVPGRGVRVQDVGRLVFTFDGDVEFFAGGRKHSEFLIGDEVLCDALG
ncbi:MAG: hypothetical protein QOI00_418 [Chloroflexota bacterium]|jgi:hypothetical protein|nr:hypothetical protein [Chloroflexota bacterium]MEA2605661.1 hypothetical protein [Chloroflexota bacterium]